MLLSLGQQPERKSRRMSPLDCATVVPEQKHVMGSIEVNDLPDSSPRQAAPRTTRLDSVAFEHMSNPANDIFDVLRNSDDLVNVNDFMKAIRMSGLRTTDPRLKECMAKVTVIAHSKDSNARNLNRFQLKAVIQENISLIQKALRNRLTIPEMETFKFEIDAVFRDCAENQSGKLADYIPQLARVDPSLWGCSLCTVTGQRHAVGDTTIAFGLQSCSKPLNYAVACSLMGPNYVHKYVGREPSGRSFNEICLDHNNKPHNPMINSGAIIVTSLIKPETNVADRFDYMMNQYIRMAGNEYVGFNNAVFQSERVTADRNFALGYYMRENNCYADGKTMNESLDLYYQLCSTEINCDSGAVIAATLANGGVNPLTGERVLDATAVRNTLSLMHSCGMYDYSGQFAFKVGLPAKSGVAGAILLVIPDVMGICTFSPLLGPEGNSARGVEFCEKLVKEYSFHHYDCLSGVDTKKNPRGSDEASQNVAMFNLLFAASNGELQAIKHFYLHDMDMNAKDYDGRTALHLAAAEGFTEIVQFLIHSCKVNHAPVDRWNSTPLQEATANGHHEICGMLQLMQSKRESLSLSSTTGGRHISQLQEDDEGEASDSD